MAWLVGEHYRSIAASGWIGMVGVTGRSIYIYIYIYVLLVFKIHLCEFQEETDWLATASDAVKVNEVPLRGWHCRRRCLRDAGRDKARRGKKKEKRNEHITVPKK